MTQMWGTWQTKAGRGGGEEVECWMTMTEADRNKMPVAERRESMMGGGTFRRQMQFFLTYYTVCMYVGQVVEQVGL